VQQIRELAEPMIPDAVYDQTQSIGNHRHSRQIDRFEMTLRLNDTLCVCVCVCVTMLLLLFVLFAVVVVVLLLFRYDDCVRASDNPKKCVKVLKNTKNDFSVYFIFFPVFLIQVVQSKLSSLHQKCLLYRKFKVFRYFLSIKFHFYSNGLFAPYC
jgi:hypothetical protein